MATATSDGVPAAHHRLRERLRAPLEGPFHKRMALLLALMEQKYVRKNFATSRDGRI
jgi:hypothetical protein